MIVLRIRCALDKYGTGKGEIESLDRHFVSLQNSLRLNLVTLGLEAAKDRPPSLERYLEARRQIGDGPLDDRSLAGAAVEVAYRFLRGKYADTTTKRSTRQRAHSYRREGAPMIGRIRPRSSLIAIHRPIEQPAHLRRREGLALTLALGLDVAERRQLGRYLPQ